MQHPSALKLCCPRRTPTLHQAGPYGQPGSMPRVYAGLGLQPHTSGGPLAACTALRVLYCYDTKVMDLSPLAACRGLESLYCSHTMVADLGPLAFCTRLHQLCCYGSQVVNLAPLASCTGLQTLDSRGVVDLAPLASS